MPRATPRTERVSNTPAEKESAPRRCPCCRPATPCPATADACQSAEPLHPEPAHLPTCPASSAYEVTVALTASDAGAGELTLFAIAFLCFELPTLNRSGAVTAHLFSSPPYLLAPSWLICHAFLC